MGGGLNRLEPPTGRVTRYRHDPQNPASLSDDSIWALHVDRAGVLWVGTFGGGLDRLDPRRGGVSLPTTVSATACRVIGSSPFSRMAPTAIQPQGTSGLPPAAGCRSSIGTGKHFVASTRRMACR